MIYLGSYFVGSTRHFGLDLGHHRLIEKPTRHQSTDNRRELPLGAVNSSPHHGMGVEGVPYMHAGLCGENWHSKGYWQPRLVWRGLGSNKQRSGQVYRMPNLSSYRINILVWLYREHLIKTNLSTIGKDFVGSELARARVPTVVLSPHRAFVDRQSYWHERKLCCGWSTSP